MVQLGGEEVDGSPPPRAATIFRSARQTDPERLLRLYGQARRPVLLVGLGALAGAARLRRLVEKRAVPVFTTPSGRGALPEDHPMAMGFDVVRGRVDVANELFDRSDLILAVGCRLGHNGSAGFQLRLSVDRLAHVDIDPEALGANYPTAVSVRCDAKEFLGLLMAHPSFEQPTEWTPGELAGFRERLRSPASARSEPAIRGGSEVGAGDFFASLRVVLPPSTILVTDSGEHQVLTRRHYDVLSPRGLIVPTDFQTMGFGLPASIGAKLGAPERPVAALIGDGGFLMSGMELVTAARDAIPLLVIVFNDGTLN